MIVIVDYGMGNLRSILHKLRKMEVEGLISARPENVERADRLILHGFGGEFAGGDSRGGACEREFSHERPADGPARGALHPSSLSSGSSGAS